MRGIVGAMLANLARLIGEAVSAGELVASGSQELVARFRRDLEQHFRSHRSVENYAAALGVAEKRLRSACLAITGQTPVQLVHLRLIVEAERQLRYTSMPIAQVAYFLGFEDPAYFSRFFTQRIGVSPRDFRLQDGLETLDTEAR